MTVNVTACMRMAARSMKATPRPGVPDLGREMMTNPLQPWFDQCDGVLNELWDMVETNKLSIERRCILQQAHELLTRAQIVLGSIVNDHLQWLQLDPGEYSRDDETQEDQTG